MFRSGVPAVKPASDAFSMFNGARQAEQTDGLEFVDQTFGSSRKEEHKCFLEENPSMEE